MLVLIHFYWLICTQQSLPHSFCARVYLIFFLFPYSASFSYSKCFGKKKWCERKKSQKSERFNLSPFLSHLLFNLPLTCTHFFRLFHLVNIRPFSILCHKKRYIQCTKCKCKRRMRKTHTQRMPFNSLRSGNHFILLSKTHYTN